MIIAALIVLEALYIFLSLKAIIREKLSPWRNAGLFFGVVAANLGSGILAGSVFRFLLIAGLLYGLMKLTVININAYNAKQIKIGRLLLINPLASDL